MSSSLKRSRPRVRRRRSRRTRIRRRRERRSGRTSRATSRLSASWQRRSSRASSPTPRTTAPSSRSTRSRCPAAASTSKRPDLYTRFINPFKHHHIINEPPALLAFIHLGPLRFSCRASLQARRIHLHRHHELLRCSPPITQPIKIDMQFPAIPDRVDG
jgi:hypothetical protein